MSLVFYYSPFSTSTVTQLALEELGVPYEKIKVDVAGGETKTPAFRGINPNGRVPVLVHDDQTIFESAAIALYLGETFGVERGLFPAPGPARGAAMQWIVWTNVTLVEAVQRYQWATSQRSPVERHNPAVATWARGDIAERLGVLDAALAGKQYILGADYSLVDAHLSASVGWIKQIELMPTGLGNIDAWLGRCMARPAMARVMAG